MDKSDVHLHVLDYAFVVLNDSSLKFYKPDLKNGEEENMKLIKIGDLNFSKNQVFWTPLEYGGFESDLTTPKIPEALHSVGPSDVEGHPEFREFLIELK